jgi:hypothetical protein
LSYPTRKIPKPPTGALAWAVLLSLAAALGCGGASGPGLPGSIDGSAGAHDAGLDRGPSGAGGAPSDGSAAAGGHGAAGAGAGGSGGAGGERSDGAALDGARDAGGHDGGSGGASGNAGSRGGASGQGGATGRTDASADLGPAGGRTGSDAGSTAGAGGGADAGLTCDPVAQTGCPAGDKCSIPPACIAAGSVGEGQLCASAGFDDCASPDLCIGDGTAHLCRQACRVGSDCHQPAVSAGATPEPNNLGRCLISLGGTTFEVCTLACNPVAAAGPSGCPAGYACQYFQTTPVPEATDCEPAGTAGENADCTTTACAGGLACVSTGTTQRCRQVCRTGNNADCAVAGDTCVMPTGVPTPMFGFCCAAAGC